MFNLLYNGNRYRKKIYITHLPNCYTISIFQLNPPQRGSASHNWNKLKNLDFRIFPRLVRPTEEIRNGSVVAEKLKSRPVRIKRKFAAGPTVQPINERTISYPKWLFNNSKIQNGLFVRRRFSKRCENSRTSRGNSVQTLNDRSLSPFRSFFLHIATSLHSLCPSFDNFRLRCLPQYAEFYRVILAIWNIS